MSAHVDHITTDPAHEPTAPREAVTPSDTAIKTNAAVGLRSIMPAPGGKLSAYIAAGTMVLALIAVTVTPFTAPRIYRLLSALNMDRVDWLLTNLPSLLS